MSSPWLTVSRWLGVTLTASIVLNVVLVTAGGRDESQSTATAGDPPAAVGRASEPAERATSGPSVPMPLADSDTSASIPPEGGRTVVSIAPHESDHDPFAVVAALPPLELPSDCPLPLADPASMPNSPRVYRAGVHQGIDFICEERGRDAVAALPGRVVMVVRSYEDPSPSERSALLDVAAQVGYTPPWTLAMLFGNFVVLDHGVISGAGHVVTIYAHLEAVDAAIGPGAAVTAGQRLGEIGNRGTHTAASGGTRARSLHLHWEIHVNGEFLGAGLSTDASRQVYGDLFAASGRG